MLGFIVTFVKADHSEAFETPYTAEDIDSAASQAIDTCPDDFFVASVRQDDVDWSVLANAKGA